MHHINIKLQRSQQEKLTTKCSRLVAEFQNYVIRTHALRKTFLSIKVMLIHHNVIHRSTNSCREYTTKQRSTDRRSRGLCRTSSTSMSVFMSVHLIFITFLPLAGWRRRLHSDGHVPAVLHRAAWLRQLSLVHGAGPQVPTQGSELEILTSIPCINNVLD